jgi:MFS superfamily sulfate permease-like transporter
VFSTGKIFILIGAAVLVLSLLWQRIKRKSPSLEPPNPMRGYKKASIHLMIILGALFLLWLFHYAGSD